MEERRKEPRRAVDATAVITPLAAVGTRLSGQVINVSSHGVKVRLTEQMTGEPRVGDVYRILSSRDRMLCEVNHCLSGTHGTDIGFRILYWSETGELNRIVETHSHSGSHGGLPELSIPRLYGR